jgi:hypothetical protein
MPENENIERDAGRDYGRHDEAAPPPHDLGVLEVDPAQIRLAPPIGGWLVLPALGLILGPILNVGMIAEELRLLKSPEMIQAQARIPGIARTVFQQCVVAGAVLVFQIFVAIMFFRKKAIAPTLMIILFTVYVAFELVMAYWTATVLGQLPPEGYSGAYRAAIAAIVWIPYFLVSQRVKETFIY